MTELNEQVTPTTEPVETIPQEAWPPEWKDAFEKPPIFTIKMKNCLPEAVIDLAEDPETAKLAETRGMGGRCIPAILFCHSQKINLQENTIDEADWELYPVQSWPGSVKVLYIHKDTAVWITKHQKWYGNVTLCWRQQPHPRMRDVYMATELYLCSGNSGNYIGVMQEPCFNCERHANRTCKRCLEAKFCSDRCESIASINGVHPISKCQAKTFLALKQRAADVRTHLNQEAAAPAAPAVPTAPTVGNN